ncbi:unnamed protein product [Cuscuta campestris]|uniref:Uncharacterized protein n=1 Tax=Cuscuta campestris TaxID=132261 RepID=A0A484LRJ9_9ASTE|nr:unnamed protein product [Cuscuta campestris]
MHGLEGTAPGPMAEEPEEANEDEEIEADDESGQPSCSEDEVDAGSFEAAPSRTEGQGASPKPRPRRGDASRAAIQGYLKICRSRLRPGGGSDLEPEEKEDPTNVGFKDLEPRQLPCLWFWSVDALGRGRVRGICSPKPPGGRPVEGDPRLTKSAGAEYDSCKSGLPETSASSRLCPVKWA